jgi:hypothetical protein
MANPRMTLLDLLNKAEQGVDPDFLRDGLKLLAQQLMDVEVTQLVGAGLHERAETRLTYRNGYREREWDTRVGSIELEIPKLRAGTYFPSLLEPRRRHGRAPLSVVQEAYIHGVSTRAVDALAEALGLKGISKDQVSRICKELDAQVHAFRTRPLDAEYPYLMLDATFESAASSRPAAVFLTKGRVRTPRLAVDAMPPSSPWPTAADCVARKRSPSTLPTLTRSAATSEYVVARVASRASSLCRLRRFQPSETGCRFAAPSRARSSARCSSLGAC